MKLLPTGVQIAVLALVALAAVGCNQDKIATLEQQNKDLTTANTQLQTDLVKAQGDADNLRNQLATKDQELLAMKNKTTPPPPPDPKAAAGWEHGLTGDRVTLGTDILFAPGSATLSAAGTHELSKIAGDLKKEYAGMKIRIYGYTDNDPIVKTKKLWSDNLDLSLNRSAAVARFMWSKGVGKDRIETIGMGDTNFAAPNTNKANKNKNRRVEIIVVRSK